MTYPKAWRERAREEAQRGPWKPEEDAQLIDATRCGLSVDYIAIGDRTFGEMLQRRLELLSSGAVQRAREI
jgi:hypothetical protein